MGNFTYKNYNSLEITSSYLPSNTHLWIETDSSGTIYMVDSVDPTILRKTEDKCDSWETIDDRSYTIRSMWWDRVNDYLYCYGINDSDAYHEIWYVDLSDDSITELSNFSGSAFQFNYGRDIFMISTSIYVTDVERINDGVDKDFFVVRKYNTGTEAMDIVAQYNDYDGHYTSVGRVVYGTVVGTNYYFLGKHTNLLSNQSIYLLKFDSVGVSLSNLWDSTSYSLTTSLHQWVITYDGSTYLYFVLLKDGDSKVYLQRWNISGSSITELSEFNVALMNDRETSSYEKAFHLTEYKIYQLHPNIAYQLHLISIPDSDAIFRGITDTFLMNNDGDMFEYTDLTNYIIGGKIYHNRQDYPYMKIIYNSDHIDILPGMFIQISGSYTVDGSTTSDQIIFEGYAKTPSQERIQSVLVENPSSEMDELKPRGIKSGRTDEIISDINDDGAPYGPTYICDGTLSTGASMGSLVLGGAKYYRSVVDDFAEHDNFTWYLRSEGALDYNDGTIDSGADLRYDGSTYTDTITQIKAWKIIKLNQVIVNGGIDNTDGEPYTGEWNDEEDQQENGINSITIEDAQLNSDALCLAKATAIGSNDTERIRVKFKFRKTTYGFIQPGQTITFKYDVTNYMTIPEAQYILDKLIIDIKSGIGYAEISSGL